MVKKKPKRRLSTARGPGVDTAANSKNPGPFVTSRGFGALFGFQMVYYQAGDEFGVEVGGFLWHLVPG